MPLHLVSSPVQVLQHIHLETCARLDARDTQLILAVAGCNGLHSRVGRGEHSSASSTSGAWTLVIQVINVYIVPLLPCSKTRVSALPCGW